MNTKQDINYNALYIQLNSEYTMIPEEISDNKVISREKLINWLIENKINTGTIGYFIILDSKMKYIAIENVRNYRAKSNFIESSILDAQSFSEKYDKNSNLIQKMRKGKDTTEDPGNIVTINIAVAAIVFNILNMLVPFVHIVGILLSIIGMLNSKSSQQRYGVSILLNTIALVYGIINIILGIALNG